MSSSVVGLSRTADLMVKFSVSEKLQHRAVPLRQHGFLLFFNLLIDLLLIVAEGDQYLQRNLCTCTRTCTIYLSTCLPKVTIPEPAAAGAGPEAKDKFLVLIDVVLPVHLEPQDGEFEELLAVESSNANRSCTICLQGFLQLFLHFTKNNLPTCHL